ncbi:MAG TPA: dienelactone hydrolase family protein [Dehalococcoidia bacterium]|nr:dienelactone hydrolase family protein [Dehalococcoidia bacterium]
MPHPALSAETITIKGHNGDEIEAYYARPAGSGRRPGVVVIHHAPGWDEWTTEVCLKLARAGYDAISPHLYHRAGGGPEPGDMAAMVRAMGGLPDAQVMGDIDAAARYLKSLPTSNGKVGCIGFCSGGRHAYIAAALVESIDAAVDCWGGGVIVSDPAQLTPNRPVAPIDYTAKIRVPLLGIFGNEDRNPDVEQVNKTEEELKKHGKTYEFYRYDGAGHGFFATDRAGYRPEQAVDGWKKVFAFYEKYLK